VTNDDPAHADASRLDDDDDDDDELLWLADDLSDRLMTGIVCTPTDLPIMLLPHLFLREEKGMRKGGKKTQTDDVH
jgi:hypothetical protein